MYHIHKEALSHRKRQKCAATSLLKASTVLSRGWLSHSALVILQWVFAEAVYYHSPEAPARERDVLTSLRSECMCTCKTLPRKHLALLYTHSELIIHRFCRRRRQRAAEAVIRFREERDKSVNWISIGSQVPCRRSLGAAAAPREVLCSLRCISANCYTPHLHGV